MRLRLLETVKKAFHEKGFIYVALGTFTYTTLAGVFWFILAAILPVEEYGLVNYYLAIASVGTSVSTLGLKTTIVTFYPKEGENGLIKQAYLLTFTTGLVTFVFLALLGQFIAAFLVIAEVALGMFLGELLGKRKYKQYAIISAGTRLTQITLSIGLYYFFNILGIFTGYILAFIVFSAKYFITLIKPEFSIKELKNKLNFTIYSYAHDLTGILASYFDKILIGFILGLTVLGYYHLAFQVYWILAILPATLLNYLLPERSGGAVSGEVEIFGIGLAIILATLAVFLSPIVVPLLFPNFTNSIILIQIMSLAVIPATIIGIRKAKLFSDERALSILLANIIAVATEILGLIFLPIWLGNIGLATAIIISQTTMMITLEYANRKKTFKHNGNGKE
ncbi:MAG: oligosaccharide flippase family protein [Candidatus Odinarchaeia archaeon]